MSKSIKFKNDTYLDSTGVVHNKELLSGVLSNILDRITIALLWSYTGETWGDGLANCDISNYNFVLIITDEDTSIVPTDRCYGNLTSNGWYENANADRVHLRHFYRSNNAIYFENAIGRGINGYTGWSGENNVLVPRRIYGIKFNVS